MSDDPRCLSPLILLSEPFRSPAVVGTSGRLIWLDYHTPPLGKLPLLQQQTHPTLLVTAHTQAALALAPSCPQLRIICAPDAVPARLDALLTLLPHLRGGPLVIPSCNRLRQARSGSTTSIHAPPAPSCPA